jgi:hypothetical protein
MKLGSGRFITTLTRRRGADLFSGSISPFLPYTNLLKPPPLHEQPHPIAKAKTDSNPRSNPNKRIWLAATQPTAPEHRNQGGKVGNLGALCI